MIKIETKLNKNYDNVLFYYNNNTLDCLSEDIKNYVLNKYKTIKGTQIITVTDKMDGELKTIHIICFEKCKCTTSSLSKVFSKFIKSNKGNYNIYLDNLSNCKVNTLDITKQFVLDAYYFSYKFERFKTKKNPCENKYALISKENLEKTITEATILATAIDNTRDLVNTPVNYLNTYELCDYVTNLTKELGTTLEILDEKKCEELKMGAFLGVNAGSLQKARLITMKYQGTKKFENPIGLVGKGVMFDTGGYSIKLNMNTMKCDMAGSATVIGIFEAVAKLKLPINLIVVIAATDNRINEHAIVTDDVLTAMNGKTIEIGSTDAEGRLTLADALTYIQTLGCKEIIDMATLTGAVVAALGSYITGVFTNDNTMVNNLIEASNEVNSTFWELPITDHIRDTVRKSPVADLVNRAAPGASAAAAFLEEFIEEGTKWVHVDIAGTAYRTSPSYQEPAGASGVGIKEVVNYLSKK